MRQLPILLCIALLLVASAFSKCTCITPPKPTTILVGKRIITLDKARPNATAVAISHGLITAVGSLDEVKARVQGPYVVNTQYQDAIITPGMIEAHCHLALLAFLLPQLYLGPLPFIGLEHQPIASIASKEAALKAIAAQMQTEKPKKLMFAWGYDPSLLDHKTPITKQDLDAISREIPILVLHASGHSASVNSAMLSKLGYSAITQIAGVVMGEDKSPNGLLEETQALMPAFEVVIPHLMKTALQHNSLNAVARLASSLGLTTLSDLFVPGNALGESLLTFYALASKMPKFPVRIVPALDGNGLYAHRGEKAASYVKQLSYSLNNPKLHIGNIKFIIDGSIQGFTARLLPPGYFNHAPNGMFNTTQTQLTTAGQVFWNAGLPIHMHANGDEATQVALNAASTWQHTPNPDARFILEHNQMATLSQFQRLKTLGGYTNLFINNPYYWGEFHRSATLGPKRTDDMDNAGMAKALGIPFSLHSDSPVTPLGPLQLMQAAITRRDQAGYLFKGAYTAITAEDALYAVTLGAATMLGLESSIGSIEVGKRADFTLLGKDPLLEDPSALHSIPVLGTLLGGHIMH